MTRDFLPRWLIAFVVGAALALLAPQPPADPLLFAGPGASDSERLAIHRVADRSTDQPRGALHHYVVPGKVSESAAGAAGGPQATAPYTD